MEWMDGSRYSGDKGQSFFLFLFSFLSFLLFFFISSIILNHNRSPFINIEISITGREKGNKIKLLDYIKVFLFLQPEETVQLSIPERLAELGMVDPQVAYHVRLLVVLHRAVGALEPRWLLALIPQMGQHRFLPFVEITTTRALVHPVPPHDSEHAAGTGVESLHLRSLFTPI